MSEIVTKEKCKIHLQMSMFFKMKMVDSYIFFKEQILPLDFRYLYILKDIVSQNSLLKLVFLFSDSLFVTLLWSTKIKLISISFREINNDIKQDECYWQRSTLLQNLWCFISQRCSSSLIHLFPMHPLSNPWKHQKTLWFSDVFRG